MILCLSYHLTFFKVTFYNLLPTFVNLYVIDKFTAYTVTFSNSSHFGVSFLKANTSLGASLRNACQHYCAICKVPTGTISDKRLHFKLDSELRSLRSLIICYLFLTALNLSRLLFVFIWVALVCILGRPGVATSPTTKAFSLEYHMTLFFLICQPRTLKQNRRNEST